MESMQLPRENEQILFTPTDPLEFQFPFDPYPIQVDFMKTLYDAIENRKIAIFESPTGTGKSLSLLCASLKWLHDNSHRDKSPKFTTVSKDDIDNEPAWVLAYEVESRTKFVQDSYAVQREELEGRLRIIREKDAAERKLSNVKRHLKKKQRVTAINEESIKSQSQEGEDLQFLLEDYQSDDDANQTMCRSIEDLTPEYQDNLSAEVRELLKNLQNQPETKSSRRNENEEEFDEIKIYFSSRTHSQLTQFTHEIRKTIHMETLRSVSLASRKQYCINNKILSYAKSDVNKLNEQCLEMQKPGIKPEKRCPYLSTKDNSRILDMRDHILARVRDIEDLVEMGRERQTCPYYSTRRAVKPAQLVTLPYNLLLSAAARASLGISLRDHVVIIDEAHNLIDTLTAIHSYTLTKQHITQSMSQLGAYLIRYKNRLSGENLVYIRQILLILKALDKVLANGIDVKKGPQKKMVMVNEFLHKAGIDHLNFFKIEKYLRKSMLSKKLNGFADKFLLQSPVSSSCISPIASDQLETPVLHISPLMQVESFLMALTHADQDGRVFVGFDCETVNNVLVESQPTQSYLRYMLLNPVNEFRTIVEEARSVVLAGGTMEPISDFLHHLFPYLPPERISRFSCGHVIPYENLLTVAVGEGPSGQLLDFTFEKRGDQNLVDETAQILVNFCNVVPDGIICFFPSYSYMDQVVTRWKVTGIIQRLERKKKVFKEPRQAAVVEQTLRDYATHIDTCSLPNSSSTGALLLSVVGGKMSEGINFSDKLGRCVIMIGLPFANLNSVELTEKIKYIQNQPGAGPDAGKEYYENLCMRAINQSIGRAIRHKNDYATIVLLDRRFCMKRIRNKLPRWIGDRLEVPMGFGKVIERTAAFFQAKKA